MFHHLVGKWVFSPDGHTYTPKGFDTTKEAAIAGFQEHSDDDYFFVAKIQRGGNAIDDTVDDTLFPNALGQLLDIADTDCVFERKDAFDDNDKHAKKLTIRLKDALKEFVKKNKYDATIYMVTEEHSVALDAEGNLDVEAVTSPISNRATTKPHIQTAIPLDEYVNNLRQKLERPEEADEDSEEDSEEAKEEDIEDIPVDLVPTAALTDIWG